MVRSQKAESPTIGSTRISMSVSASVTTSLVAPCSTVWTMARAASISGLTM